MIGGQRRGVVSPRIRDQNDNKMILTNLRGTSFIRGSGRESVWREADGGAV